MQATSGSQRWVFGPVIDLLFGCGLGYVLLAAALATLPFERIDLLAWGVLASFMIGMPHYGATALRVYERREDRQQYAFFAVWASLFIWAVFVLGVFVPLVGSLLLTVYITWSPYHYTGQNYGLAVMFLRRRGVTLDPTTKRSLQASFVLSYVLVFLTLHGSTGTGYVPASFGGGPYDMLRLGITRTAFGALFGLTLLAHVATLAVATWRARAHLGDLGPAAMLIATQSLWFTVPATTSWLRGVELSQQYVFFFTLWVGTAHSIQYLWITTYYAAGSKPAIERARYLGKTILAGGLLFGLPPLLFLPDLLGGVPYESGLWLLAFAAINLQHFVLDGAIWKLRDGPVARILLNRPDAEGGRRKRGRARQRKRTDETTAIGDARQGGWRTRAAWGLATVSTLVVLGAALEYHLWFFAKERGDHVRAASAERRLTLVGRDNPLFYERRARVERARGNVDGALSELEANVRLYPSARAWNGLARAQLEAGDVRSALASYEASLGVEETPEATDAVRRLRGRVQRSGAKRVAPRSAGAGRS